MQLTEEQESRPAVAQMEPESEPLTPLASDARQPGDDEDDSPDAIFLRAVSEIPTQPLPKHRSREEEIVERHFIFCVLLVVLSLLVTNILNIINQPVVTVTLFPVHKSLHITTTIPLQTRQLAPVTLTRTLTAQTTGHGHQEARPATGTLTLYNGLFTQQTIPRGTVFTGADGVKMVTDEAVTIPASNPTTNPPQLGYATVPALAVVAGSSGNIAAYDINATFVNGVSVKNTSPFSHGQDARGYQAVAQRDLDTLTSKLQQQLTQAILQAFRIAPGEEVTPTNCVFTASADHGIGEETQKVTVKAIKTCSAIAYSQDALQKKAVTAFTTTRPGKKYELVSGVRTSVMSVSPFLVRCSGSWEYVFTSDYEQYLAEQITGDTPAQARAYLLKTGVVSQATITQSQTLPDPYHIKFVILVGV